MTSRRKNREESISIRRWTAAKTDRLNAPHWKGAQDSNINQDISGFQTALRVRSTYELANNPILEGIVRTHQTDVIGSNGPTLQVSSSNSNYNEKFERLWREWWEMPDAQGRRSGVDVLRQWVYMFWGCGESLEQFVTVFDADGPVKLRLLAIHPRRLLTPLSLTGEPNVALGIRLDKIGRSTAYYVASENRFGDFGFISPTEFSEIPARDMLHIYLTDEPDQIRGIPFIASALPVIADLRDYDTQVLDAARAAADWCAFLVNQNPGPGDQPRINGEDCIEMRRRTLRALPQGWTVAQMNPEQPSTNYVDYRRERMAEMGRAVNMPLMMIRLDSHDHNYSSARFDAQIYSRGLETFQAMLGRGPLTRILKAFEREADLAGVLPRRPNDVRYVWRWTPMPHVDPSKEAMAERIRMANLELSWRENVAAHGKDPETVLADFTRDAEAFKTAGLPFPWLIDWQKSLSPQGDGKPANENDEDGADVVEKKQSR